MDADDFRDYMLSFLFQRYLSDNYETAAKKELGDDYPKLEDAGIHMAAQRTMDLMRNLHSCLCWNGEKEKAWRMIEEPRPDQARILAAFGYEVERGVLQKIKN
jgi:type I restriction-modification system DNA methylase subunit